MMLVDEDCGGGDHGRPRPEDCFDEGGGAGGVNCDAGYGEGYVEGGEEVVGEVELIGEVE